MTAPTPASPARPLRRRAPRLLAALVAVALIGACAGERPELVDATAGSAPATSGEATTTASEATTSEATTSEAAPVDDGVLGPEDLLGFIATPVGDPVVRAEPTDDAEAIQIPATTAAGAPTTFAVIGDPEAGDAGWHEILLPTRPNGARAWVPADSVTVARTPFRVFVDLAGRRLRVENDGAEVFGTEVAVGESANPTPVGASYVTELIESIEPDGAYGPYAFGLALHSDTLTEFAGGPGQVGIHGTNQPNLIGQNVSNGCIRLNNDDIRSVVDLQLPLGVPVFIT